MRARQKPASISNLQISDPSPSFIHLLGLPDRRPTPDKSLTFLRFLQQAKQDDILLRRCDITSYGIRCDPPFFAGPSFAFPSQEPAHIYHQQTETKTRHSLAFSRR